VDGIVPCGYIVVTQCGSRYCRVVLLSYERLRQLRLLTFQRCATEGLTQRHSSAGMASVLGRSMYEGDVGMRCCESVLRIAETLINWFGWLVVSNVSNYIPPFFEEHGIAKFGTPQFDPCAWRDSTRLEQRT
jgi:hypothetical protein